jgi:hypothetical protein
LLGVSLGEIGLPLATPGKLIKDAAAEGNGDEELPLTGPAGTLIQIGAALPYRALDR